MRYRAPTKFTNITSTSENGGPGSPAQLKNAWTGVLTLAAPPSMAALSRRSTSRNSATSTAVGLMSTPITSAPSSARILAVASPIPDAAPVTITCRPS